MAQMLGYTEEEMLGKPVFSFMDEEGMKLTTVHMERRKQGVKEQLEFEFVCRDGKRIDTLLETSPILDEDGTYIGSIAGVQDITERKQLEEQVRHQKDFLAGVLESLPHPFYVVDANDYTIKMANSAAAFDRRSKRPTCYAVTHGRSEPCEGPEHLCPLKKVKKTRSPVVVEHVHCDQQDNRVNVEVHAYPIFDQEGSISEVIEYTLDITERRRMEEARAEQAAALARAKEIQQSRQRIVTAQESLRRDIAQQIHGAVQNRLVMLIHRLQELQQAAALSAELFRQLTEIRQDIAELLENQLRPIAYQLYPSVLRRGLVAALQSLRDRLEISLVIEMEIDDELLLKERHDHNVISEPVRLAAYRITEEAIGNVLKHASADKVAIRLQSLRDRVICLDIWDNGKGFDAESLSYGLGIAFMRDYAELVGGECAVWSVLGKGTRVTATLPLATTAEELPERVSP